MALPTTQHNEISSENSIKHQRHRPVESFILIIVGKCFMNKLRTLRQTHTRLYTAVMKQ